MEMFHGSTFHRFDSPLDLTTLYWLAVVEKKTSKTWQNENVYKLDSEFLFQMQSEGGKKGKLFCALNGWALIMIALFWHQNVQLQNYCSISWQQANFSWLVQTKQWWFYHSLGRIIFFCSDIPIHVRNNALLCPMTKAWHWNSWNFMTQFNFASIMRQQHRLDRNNGRFIKYVSPTQSLKPLHPWN